VSDQFRDDASMPAMLARLLTSKMSDKVGAQRDLELEAHPLIRLLVSRDIVHAPSTERTHYEASVRGGMAPSSVSDAKAW